MTCIPKENKKSRRIAFACMMLGILLWMISSLDFRLKVLVQLAAVGVMVVGLQFLLRYVLSEYRYVLEDDDYGDTDLLIFKAQGSRETKVAHIELSKVTALFRLADEPDFENKYGKTNNRFNYCRNPGRDVQWVMIYCDGEDRIDVRFEPDEAMVGAIRKKIPAPQEKDESAPG